jgi:hypothetical protein
MMADVLTHLRELGVGFFFYEWHKRLEDITPSFFLEVCKNNIKNCQSLKKSDISSSTGDFFSEREINTIKNGFKLASKIQEIFNICKNPYIVWSGKNSQSGNTIDLVIDKYRFSLKEDSFILDNMGLYRYLNLITNSDKFTRGLHVFRHFSENEFNDWFDITRDLLIKHGPNPFIYKGKDYKSIAKIDKKLTLHLEYIKTRKPPQSTQISNFNECNYSLFLKSTNANIREKVFSKWLKEKVEANKKYIDAKKHCALTSGNNICEFLKPYVKTTPESLPGLFKINNEEYYYAKSTDKTIEIYFVPDIKVFQKKIIIDKIYCNVPKSQLNIYTLIKNTDNEKTIEFRNEMRYSHGQFNGTPEAKFYLVKGNTLAEIYENIYMEIT